MTLQMYSVTKNKFFKIIEWFCFICLCGLSVYCMRDNLDKFVSRKKSFTQSEEPISKLPTAIFCFTSKSDASNNQTYQFGTDFKTEYCVDKSCSNLDEGENFIEEENVNFEIIVTQFLDKCYKITSTSNSIGIGKVRSLQLYFNESIPTTFDVSLKVYIS